MLKQKRKKGRLLIKRTACVVAALGLSFTGIPGLTDLMPAFTVNAADNYTQGLTQYEYELSNNTIKITKITSSEKTVSIPSEINGYTVTALGSNILKNDEVVEEVIVPNSVLQADNGAFASAKALRQCTLSNRMNRIPYEMFSMCENLENVTFSSSLMVIGDYAFDGCTNLNDFTIPWSVIEIGTYAFRGCMALREMTIPSSVTTISNGLFINSGVVSVTLPETAESMGSEVFNGCSSLTQVNIPSGIKTIFYNLFRDCTSLKAVVIPEGVTRLGGFAFYGCTSLSSVTLPESLRDIESAVFTYCYALEEVTIPAGVTSIPDRLFNECGLKKFIMSDTVTSMGDHVFDTDVNLSEVHLSNKLTSIGEATFFNCFSLGEVNIPEGVTTLKDDTFFDCRGLAQIELPAGLKSIGANVFHQNVKLNSITLPDGLTTVGEYAFDGCETLAEIRIPDTVSSIAVNAFDNIYERIVNICTENDYVKNILAGLDSVNFTTPAEFGMYTRYEDESGKYVLSDNEDGTYTIINFLPATSDVTLTSSINGKTVTSIGLYAVSYCGKLERLTIPDTITTLSDYSFEGNPAMKSVKISNNISVLPMRCFAECTALTDVTIPDSVIEITYSVFCDCSALKTVRFGANVEYTNFGAFRRCTSLERVVLPDSLTFINSWTFEGCSSLKSVVIPASVTEIYTEVFDNCPELTIYGKADTVAEQYAADNGIAFVAMSDREEQISEFVERMYTVVLDRASEEEGFQVWKNWIMSGEHTAAEMTNAFINSSEFTLKNLSDDEYLDVLYRAVMGRESDNDGVASWKEVLSNGVSRNFVLSYFITSSEFTDISTSYGMTPGTLTLTENRDQNYGVTSFVQRFYTKVLNRNAEVDGINGWTGYILNKECTPAQAAKIFVFSDEANALDRDDTEFIYMLYRTFMGRECESAESLNIWINYLGEHSREALFEQFAGSKEFAAIIASYGL